MCRGPDHRFLLSLSKLRNAIDDARDGGMIRLSSLFARKKLVRCVAEGRRRRGREAVVMGVSGARSPLPAVPLSKQRAVIAAARVMRLR